MNRKNNGPFSPSPEPRKAAPVYKQPPPRSVPRGFREAMLHVSVKSAPNNSNTRTPDTAAKTTHAQKRPAPPPAAKWKSSFKPVDEEEDDDDNAKKKNTNSPERVELYDPYNPASSDTEDEMPQAQDDSQSLPNPDNNLERQRLSLPDLDDNLECQRLSLPDQDNNLERQRLPLPDLDNNLERQRLSPPNQDNNLERKRLSPRRAHWDVEAGSRLLDRRDFNPEHRPAESRDLSPGYRLPERPAYSPDVEPLDPSGYASTSRPLDHRVCSPDRLIHSSSTQRFPASYGAQRTNSEERIVIPEYRREVSPMATTVRLSPPRLQRDYQYQSGYVEEGLDKITPSTDVTRNRSKILIMDKNPITCDLCDVVLANGQELLDHLESKTHWDTLEHIQQENNYDDLAIAFLQEFLLYKSRQCSRAIEDSVLPALQENDHMTRIEIFHCAACNVFLSTSASSVQTHITSQEHLSSTKEFEVQQRHACLGKAETMMKELKPQFEHFLKGGSPFD